VPEIIEEIFRDRGFTDYDKRLSCEYRKWEYCVQYRETDFNFISRLMEQEGIYYYFEHENGKHLLVMADSHSAHEAYPKFEKLIYHPSDKGPITEECISDWLVETHLQPGSYAINDFSFKKPQTPLLAKANASGGAEQGGSKNSYEIYDYPGDYTTSNEGTEYARNRIEELQAEYQVITAKSDSRGICPGYIFNLSDHPLADQNQEYLVTSANYTIQGDDIFSNGAAGSEFIFSCSFTTIKSSKAFRSQRITPKPKIYGPQTAFVVGPAADEICTDEFGRVKVKFHWDRYSNADENSSCWIRVAQVWAGKKWGAMYIPRIGQEVIVEFMEGNPDRPIITGRVYNAKAMPPYDLPGNGTISTLKSNSSMGGEGFNEIRFEDKKGEEQIYIHGEKNMDVRVENDALTWIGNDQHLTVKANVKELVEKNTSIKIEGDRKTEIKGDENLTVESDRKTTVKGKENLVVEGDVAEEFKSDHHEKTTGHIYIQGKSIVIEADMNITIKVGQSYVAIAKDGIKVGSMGNVDLEATGQASMNGTAGLSLESTAITELKGTTTSINGTTLTEVKGLLVKIN